VRFTLAISSSHSFGSTPYNTRGTLKCPRPFGLAFAVAPPATGLTLLHRVTRRPVLQKVRHHAFCQGQVPEQHSTLTACKHMVSGSISFPSRGAFHLSLTVLVHYRSPGYLALESGLPSFPPGSSCPVVLRIPRGRVHSFEYGAVTLYGRPFQARSSRDTLL
jgi:hypothetical protein